VLRPGRKKAARDDPKCHYSRLYRAGVFFPVVAHPIQDMSEVSITHKTVGIRLPRLWCGAVGLSRQLFLDEWPDMAKKALDKIPPGPTIAGWDV
jgi:hypothetical protein